MESMKGRCAIRGCRQLESETENKRRKVSPCGLWSLPDEVAMSCLVHVSRLDLAALAMASKRHRSLVVSRELRNLRYNRGCVESWLYVCLRIFPERNPRWFVLHPLQRRLKALPVHQHQHQHRALPESSSSFVTLGRWVYVIGGLVNGKPTSDVSFFDCYYHTVSWMPPMKMARASASASLIKGKIYVFGGLRDDSNSDSSNWAEVYDIQTKTWDLLFVSTPKMPLNIQGSVVIDVDGEKKVLAVDKDKQDLFFSPSKSVFSTSGKFDYITGRRQDLCAIRNGKVIFARGSGGSILWCLSYEMEWLEVKGLQELPFLVNYNITKLCVNSAGNIVIFWNSNPQGSQSFELWSAEISVDVRQILEPGLKYYDVWGEIVWSAAVFSHSCKLEVLFADSVYA